MRFILAMMMVMFTAATEGCMSNEGFTEKTRIDWQWTNVTDHNLFVDSSYWDPRCKTRWGMGPGLLTANPNGGGTMGNYDYVPEVVDIYWRRDDYNLPEKINKQNPIQHFALPVREKVGDTFVGNLWIRYDGKTWTVTPQTREEYEKHRKYSLYPSAPWQPEIVTYPYRQFKLAEKDKSLYQLTTFNEADVKRAAALRQADAAKGPPPNLDALLRPRQPGDMLRAAREHGR